MVAYSFALQNKSLTCPCPTEKKKKACIVLDYTQKLFYSNLCLLLYTSEDTMFLGYSCLDFEHLVATTYLLKRSIISDSLVSVALSGSSPEGLS